MQMKKHEIADAIGLQGIYISVVAWKSGTIGDTDGYSELMDMFIDAWSRESVVFLKSQLKEAIKDEA